MSKRDSNVETANEIERVLARLDRMETALTNRMDRLEDKTDAKFSDVQKSFTTLYWRLLVLALGTISGTAALIKVLDYLFQ